MVQLMLMLFLLVPSVLMSLYSAKALRLQRFSWISRVILFQLADRPLDKPRHSTRHIQFVKLRVGPCWFYLILIS